MWNFVSSSSSNSSHFVDICIIFPLTIILNVIYGEPIAFVPKHVDRISMERKKI